MEGRKAKIRLELPDGTVKSFDTSTFLLVVETENSTAEFQSYDGGLGNSSIPVAR